jgi:uncharacterized protein
VIQWRALPPPTFLNRTTELRLLNDLWASRRAELMVLYGRRRVGKTELLVHLADRRRAILLEATDFKLEDQLRDFGSAYADALNLGSVVLQVESWERALALIAEAARAERTLVVLDEFQYLAKQAPGLSSLLARWWRTTGSSLDLMLVLSGSEIAFFADEVLGVTGPLHGRRTAEYRLRPFSAIDAPLFIPEWTAEDRVRSYAIWGGVPYYLSMIDPSEALSENILTSILRPGAPLQREADYLIRMESRLRDVALYGSILRGLAGGRTRLSELSGYLGTGTDGGNLSRQLERLAAVDLVSELRPVTQARKGAVRYQISDPFLRFSYRFTAPAAGRLATHAGAQRYLDRVVMPELDGFTSAPTYQEICQAHLQRLFDAAVVGRWWGPVRENRRDSAEQRTVEREADGVALDDRGEVIALATCKWSNSPTAISEVNKLRRIAAVLAPGREIPIVVYSRSGVDERILEEQSEDSSAIRLVSPTELYA